MTRSGIFLLAKLLRWPSIMTKVAFCVSTGQLNSLFPLASVVLCPTDESASVELGER